MHIFGLSPTQFATFISFLLYIRAGLCTARFELERRGQLCCTAGDCSDDDQPDEAPTLDGPTSDKSAGIGVEFESGEVQLRNPGCNEADTFASKKAMIGNRQGQNWKLTADTLEDAGVLTAEYILDGTQIKIGSGAAATAAEAVANDITDWDPSAQLNPNTLGVHDSKCNPWAIGFPEVGGSADQLVWAPQVTAPLPLESINDLFAKAAAKGTSALLPRTRVDRNIVSVTKGFFRAKPNGISSDSVEADVLGFFSLIMSYAKAARAEDENQSPKNLISIMPRTDFTNIFNQVKSSVPGTLYDIVKILACYKDETTLDTAYCGGSIDDPVPNAKMDGQEFSVSSSEASQSCTVKDWTQSIQDNDSPDCLSEIDKVVDGQIGGLGSALENVLDTSRAVPLFEFRRLPNLVSGEMKDRVTQFEQAVIDYHKSNANTARFVRRRLDNRFIHIKRKDISAACPSPTAAASQTAAAGTETTAAGAETTAAGAQTTATGAQTTATGAQTTAAGTQTTAAGAQTTAAGSQTTAAGALTTAAGAQTTAVGPQTTTAPPTTIAPVMLSCFLQNESPEQGIDAKGCICGTRTLPLLTVEAPTDISQSCSYTAWPSADVPNPITVETRTWTSNCQACTLAGGFADVMSCTAVVGCLPTMAAPLTTAAAPTPSNVIYLSNNSLPIGDAVNANGGKDLRENVYTQLHGLCPDDQNSCDSKTPGVIDEIPTVVGDGDAYEKLTFIIQDSYYESTSVRDLMLSLAVSSWQGATSKNCQEVEYKDEPDMTGSGCGTGPVKKRDLPTKTSLEKRSPLCEDCSPPQETCTYKTTICAGPDHINPVFAGNAGPYANHMNIQLSWELDGDSAFNTFICEAIIDGVTALALAVAPELAEIEIPEDIDFQATCEGLVAQIGT